jgi:hypothetical protein
VPAGTRPGVQSCTLVAQIGYAASLVECVT